MHLARHTVNDAQQMIRRDVRAFAKQIAFTAAAKPYQEVWKDAKLLGMGSLRRASSAIRPVAPLKREDGHILTEPSDQALRWFRHFAAIEAGVSEPAAIMLQHAVERRFKALEKLPTPTPATVATQMAIERAIRAGRNNRGFSEDVIPNDVIKLAPAVFASFLLPLALKTTALAMEPIQHKGGMLMQLFKGRGVNDVCDHFRRIMLTDCIGKTNKEVTREQLMPYAEDYFLETQRGGLPGRGTEQSAHMARLFLEYTRGKGYTSAVLFVDAVAALYSVARRLIVGLDDSDEAIAYIMKAMN